MCEEREVEDVCLRAPEHVRQHVITSSESVITQAQAHRMHAVSHPP